jgi:hypothetical protein
MSGMSDVKRELCGTVIGAATAAAFIVLSHHSPDVAFALLGYGMAYSNWRWTCTPRK